MVAPAPTPVLQLQQVSLKAGLGSHDLLHDISFEVSSGDRVAIVGPSGAGKTMLLQLLNRLRDPSRGAILLNGRDLRQIPVRQLRQRVMVVAQETSLLGMTVQDALTYPLKLRGLAEQTQQQRISRWMELLNIPTAWLDRTEGQLSVGQRQLVAIARGLVTEPEIIALDEPTSALDAGRSSLLSDVLKTASHIDGMTTLMVNHQLEVAETFANQLIYLEQGRLIDSKSAEHVDWAQLKTTLVEAEQQAAAEWE